MTFKQFGFIVMLSISFIGSYFINSSECTQKWKDSGFNYKFGYFSGCLIQTSENDRWLPSDTYREISK